MCLGCQVDIHKSYLLGKFYVANQNIIVHSFEESDPFLINGVIAIMVKNVEMDESREETSED